ncbi:restriction endonuclease subunit S [Methylomonas sp. BW4-1]|uniref:restriction endonuclease subunit S n=1 Tax=Methylomonas sp. BW4-1 TaxID=3376685 RepID=UPI004042913A
MSRLPEVPSTWTIIKLGEVVDYGKTVKVEPNKIESSAWVLELEDIEKHTSKLLARCKFSDRDSKSTKNYFEIGDVLYGKLRPYLNKVLIADQAGYCSTEIIPLKANDNLDARFLFYWLKHPAFLDYVEAESHGLNMPRLGTETGRAAPFVLAPFNEQKRIADKLDAVLAQVDACRDRLDRIPAIIKRFRQSVLAAAVSGKLTEDWRLGKYLYRSIDNDLEIPENWRSVKLADLSDYVTSGSRGWADFYSNKGAIFIRSQDINTDELVLQNTAYVDLPDIAEGRRTKVELNDLLITITGANVTKCARVKSNLDEAYVSQHVSLVRLIDVDTAPFVEFAIKAINCGRKQLMTFAYGGGKPGLNLQNIKDVTFGLPPSDEQTEIIRRVESLFAYADRLEARYYAARTQVEKLTPALLAKAFRGELVPQDPNDEPASELLARIVATKADAPPKKRAGKQLSNNS